MITRVKAVITAYRPDVATLGENLTATAPQVETLLLVANDGAPWSCQLPGNVALVRQAKNIGLGAAYNLAARWAREQMATHLLLLDQDSVPASGMVAALMEGFQQPGPVAAVGPLWRDSRTKEDGFFVRLARWGARKYRPAAGEIVPVDFLISSGSLISLAALADIGPYDEGLFLEHTDTDWALRARAKGYRFYGVADARLDHVLGDAALSVSPLGLRRRFFVHKPERNYYLLRNSLALWRRHYAPWSWVIHDVRRTFLLMVFYALFVPPRLARLRSMFRAVRDGLAMG